MDDTTHADPEAPAPAYGPPPSAPASRLGSGMGSGMGSGPRVSAQEMKAIDRLRRTIYERRVAGVCGGIARHFDVDPLLVRVLMGVSAVLGAGFLAYLALWLVIPEEGTERSVLELEPRTRTFVLWGFAGLLAFSLITDWSHVAWLDVPAGIFLAGYWLTHRHRSPGPVVLTRPVAVGDVSEFGGPTLSEGPVAPYDRALAAAQAYPAPPPHWRERRRKQGPVLFWFTLAAIALVTGVLGIAHSAGLTVTPAAYVAAGLTVVSVMLIVGSFYGRPGGLVFLGLVGCLCLGATTAGASFDGKSETLTPTSSSQVQDNYSFDNGELVLDLTEVGNARALDGRTVDLRGNNGRLAVAVPSGIDLVVHADISGPGVISLPGNDTTGSQVQAGMRRQATWKHDAPGTDQQLTLDLYLKAGVIDVIRSK